jgi:hypothetical protein
MSNDGFQNTRLLNRGVEHRRFQDIRRWLLAGRWVLAGGPSMADRELDRLCRELSREQLAEFVCQIRHRL